MTMPAGDVQMAAVVWMMVKVCVLLAAAMAFAWLCRRRSAAARHLVWTCTIAGLLILPLLSAVLPPWNLAIRGWPSNLWGAAPVQPQVGPVRQTSRPSLRLGANVAPEVVTTAAPASQSPGAVDMSWATALFGLYLVGALCLLLRLFQQRVTLSRIAGAAAPVRDPAWQRLLVECAASVRVHRPVRLLCSREHTMPMAFGIRQPAILIPVIAATWSEDRRRVVLLHELAHVARQDCLTQLVAAVACAIHWMHPGVWWVARRLRVERELACDDRVIMTGTNARDYAGHLLELAYALGGQRAVALAVGMARPRQLEARMLAMLDGARNRSTPGHGVRLVSVAIVLALLVPVAGLRAQLVPTQVSSATPKSVDRPSPSFEAKTPATVTRHVDTAADASNPSARQDQRTDALKDRVSPLGVPGLTVGDSFHGTKWPIGRLGVPVAFRSQDPPAPNVPVNVQQVSAPSAPPAQERGLRVSVDGNVRTAGTYVLGEDATLISVLMRAGLITGSREATITRSTKAAIVAPTDRVQNTETIVVNLTLLEKELERGVLGRNLRLQDGDRVHISNPTVRVFVTGQVKLPGAHSVPGDTTVIQLLTLAGGVTPSAAVNRTSIVRIQEGKSVSLPAKLEDVLLAGDTVIVPERRF